MQFFLSQTFSLQDKEERWVCIITEHLLNYKRKWAARPATAVASNMAGACWATAPDSGLVEAASAETPEEEDEEEEPVAEAFAEPEADEEEELVVLGVELLPKPLKETVFSMYG